MFAVVFLCVSTRILSRHRRAVHRGKEKSRRIGMSGRSVFMGDVRIDTRPKGRGERWDGGKIECLELPSFPSEPKSAYPL